MGLCEIGYCNEENDHFQLLEKSKKYNTEEIKGIALPKKTVEITESSVDAKETKTPEPPLIVEEKTSTNPNVKKNIDNGDEKQLTKAKSAKIGEIAKANGAEKNQEFISRRNKSKLSITVRQPKELTSKKIKQETVRLFNKSRENIKIQRNRRKIPTVIERSKLSQKILKEEGIDLALYNEILIMHENARPTERYKRGKLIGKGTLGPVYEATNKIFNNIVAMKIIEKKRK